MATVTQNDLRIRNAHNMVRHLSDEPCYMFIGRSEPWMSRVEQNPRPRMMLGDESVPNPDNNWEDFYKTWDHMLSMAKVLSKDVFHMIPRVSWTSGVTFDMYRHDYSETNRSFSNASNLYNARFYVISRTNNVYVCLDNAKATPSTVEPLSERNEPFYTSDGYQWMKIFTVGSFTQIQHSSNNFIPIVSSEVNNRPEGAINTVVIDSRGTKYMSSAFKELTEINECYCKIIGDGVGAVAKLTISAGRIFQIRVVREGVGYTRAQLDFRPNHVYSSLLDLDEGENGFDPKGDGSFRSTVIIPPPGGWGTDIEEEMKYTLARQLGGTRVGVYATFLGDTEDFFFQSSFRQIGIMDDVEFANDEEPATASVALAVKVKEPINTLTTEFEIGETIYQLHKDSVDPSIVYRAKASVVGWDDATGILRYVQDPDIHRYADGVLYKIEGGSSIIGETTGKEVIPDINFGVPEPVSLDGIVFEGGYMIEEVNRYSGTMLYLTNLSPIQRVSTQSERVSIIISY